MKPPTLKLALLAGAVLGGALLSSCRVSLPNPNHCFHADGDLTCAEIDPELPFCVSPECGSQAYGCVAEQPSADCHSPCGADATAVQDMSCVEPSIDTDTDTNTDTDPDTDTETDTSEDECASNDECPVDAGFCLFGTCTPCDGTPNPTGACIALTDGEAPLCLDGDCVECTQDDPGQCIDAQLACDLETNTCIPCTDQSQCPNGAGCDTVVGSCLPADAVWHVDGDGGHDFLTIAEAMAEIGDGSGTIIIHENLFGQDYLESISFAGVRTLALLHVPGQHPEVTGTEVALNVSAGARVYARGLTLYADTAVRVTAGSYIELDSSRLTGRVEGAMFLEDSLLAMRNSTMRNSDLINSIALFVDGDSSINITYSTFVSGTNYVAVACFGTLAPGSIIRNSLIANLGTGSSLYCPDVIMEHNGLELDDWNDWKIGNTQISPMSDAWFKNLAQGDLHLTNQAPVVLTTAAVWQEGDPLVDIDQDPRPAIEGEADYLGADRLP